MQVNFRPAAAVGHMGMQPRGDKGPLVSGYVPHPLRHASIIEDNVTAPGASAQLVVSRIFHL